ncbi:MAG TPA: DUF4058 family protein [Pirellulales bacterium]|nr:DUF4058 family protein [Pirellulales bacterium]
MPIHDWSRVEDGIFHAFHMGWNWQLQEALNAGRLPRDYYGLVEQQTLEGDEEPTRRIADLLTLNAGPSSEDLPPLPPAEGGLALAEAPPKVSHRATLEPDYRLLRRTLAIRHVSGRRLVAVIEMVSPANKDRLQQVEQFVSKVAAFLDAGIHVLLIDSIPPGTCDPHGMHGAIGRWIDAGGGAYQWPATKALTLASYRAAEVPEAFVEHLSVGQPLPDMPLFFSPGRYVNVPLEATYMAAFAAMPQFWRDKLGD